MHQLVEYILRMFEDLFPRSKDFLEYEDHGEQRISMVLYVLLFNMRSKMLVINQIWSDVVGEKYWKGLHALKFFYQITSKF